jgi:hypothetical protein
MTAGEYDLKSRFFSLESENKELLNMQHCYPLCSSGKLVFVFLFSSKVNTITYVHILLY